MKRLWPYIGALLAAILLAIFEGDLLYTAQEQDLFLHTPLFFEQRMVTAGGLLTWIGSFLTQLFYYPLLGAGVLCLLWLFLVFLLQRAFELKDGWLTLLPIACLLLPIVDLGYWIYYMKLSGHLFDATVGTMVAVTAAWAYRLMPRKLFLSTLFIVLVGCVGYPLFGFYGLLAVVLMGLLSYRADSHRMVDCLVAVVTMIGVPLVCYHLLYHETHIANIYWTALPTYAMSGVTYTAYYLPYVGLVVSLCLLSLIPSWKKWIQVVILAAAWVSVAVFWYKDDNFRRELKMSRSCDKQEWEQVLEVHKQVKGEPTRAMCMMKNLALFRLGRQGDEMFHYPEGAKRPEAPFPVRMVHTVGKMLYLKYGVPNYCFRWCMEDGVEYGFSVEKLKLMAICCLLNGEGEAAMHFLRALKKTDFHKSWARKYERYVHRPPGMRSHAELMAIADLMGRENFLTADQSQMERFLVEHFATAESKNPLLQEQVLLATMQAKDMPGFWKQFYQYTEIHRGEKVPVHYQEAACLFGHLNNIDVSHMPFDEQVVKNYQGFAGTVGEYQRQGMSIEKIRPLVYDRYHQTYYYDFYFNRYNYAEK